MNRLKRTWAGLALLGLAAVAAPAGPARAASASEIDAKADIALKHLLETSEAARAISDKAIAVLIFPNIVEAGFGVGGQYGEGALRRNGVTTGYYNIAAASFGFQIGAQSFSEIMFFMNEDALKYLDRSKGLEVGADATVTVADEGMSVGATSSTIQDPIVAFVVGQQGLMAGATVQGSKITKINPGH